MNLMSKTLSSVIVGVAGMIPLAAVGASLPQTGWAVASMEEKEINGSISAVGMDDNSFTITDDQQNEHRVTTNEKTRYTLDGEVAARAQVIVKGADVEAKVADGVAVHVNRVTE